MPKVYKKKSFKKKSKKFVKKTKPRNKSSVSVGLGFPKRMTMTHKYFEIFDMYNTGGAISTYQFSANGMYDPNLTSGGHQPFYFDQMSAVYNHYTVIGSKITVKFGSATATNTAEVACLWLNDDTTTTPTLNSLVEQSSAKHVALNFGNVDTHTLRLNWSAKKTFGGSVLGNDNLQGTATANPTEQSVYQISIYPHNLTSTQAFNVQVLIEYIAVWEEIKDIQGS